MVRVVALCVFAAALGWAQEPAAAAHIPTARGTTLAGKDIALPNSLNGKFGVLVLGFSHASQEQVADWGRLIEAQYGQSPRVTYFEVAMLGRAPKMLRGMIVKQMTSSVPGAERAHFVPLLEDDKPWRAVAHFGKSDDAYLLVVDRDGLVIWQTEGDATDAAWAEFKAKMNALLAPGAAKNPAE
jgi:hypothetical protein